MITPHLFKNPIISDEEPSAVGGFVPAIYAPVYKKQVCYKFSHYQFNIKKAAKT
jgi:hypothetical protein